MTSSFDQLTTDTLAKIKGFGIKSRSVFKAFRRSCRMLKAYLEENDIEFSFDTGQKWLLQGLPCEPLTYSQYVVHSANRRAVFLLSDCQAGQLDSWRIYPQKTAARPETAEYLQLLRSHEERLRTVGMATATIDFAMRVDSDFLIYLEKAGKVAINNVMPHDVIGYFTQDSFSGRKPDGVKAYAYKLKSFLEFLEDTDAVKDKKLSLAVPKVFAKQSSIVTILSEKAVKELRYLKEKSNTSTTARDCAMIMLALRLGIRRSDIIKMKLTDIDWKNDKISFVQQKTGIPVTLPLLPDVGNALVNYILNFRPQSSCDTVFLRLYAPHQTLSPCHDVVEKYLTSCDSADCPQGGFHILRRTFATTMMRNNIPRSVISASIGQTDPNSVDVYLSADEDKMRKCAISLKRIECTRGDLR